MEKHSYEALKAIREKVAAGTATFAERNIANIIAKKRRKEKPVQAPKTVNTKRAHFGRAPKTTTP